MTVKNAALRAMLAEAESVVFFGGAGVSTPSGIPDFRSGSGIYQTNRRAETMLSHSFFIEHPAEFYDFYRSAMLYPQARPNIVHKALAQMERDGKLKAVITQNIDGLHQLAGSRQVWELHGSTQRNYCMRCGRKFGVETILQAEAVPHCPVCGGMIRPDVVLYEEPLDESVWEGAEAAIRSCDLLLVGGTSLTVYPAASLVRIHPDKKLVILNASPTPYDAVADLVLRDPLETLFEE